MQLVIYKKLWFLILEKLVKLSVILTFLLITLLKRRSLLSKQLKTVQLQEVCILTLNKPCHLLMEKNDLQGHKVLNNYCFIYI